MHRFLKSAALAAGLAVVLSVGGMAIAQSPPPPPVAVAPQDLSWQDSLKRQTGRVSIPGAHATLDLGDDYYYIGPDDSRKVLVDGWGNPPDAANNVLGMIFPKRFKPMDDDSWGAVITYNDIGYVSDDDARTADYQKLLDDMRSGEAADNQARREKGYPELNLVGWAEPPRYVADTHVVIWARELAVSGKTNHGLNYDIRVLGREGVLSLNVVAGMADLADIHDAASGIARTAQFDAGSRYADYREGVDKSAGIGIAGLVAAGVGVAAAKKLGLLGLLLVFGKKLIVFVVAGFGMLMAWLRRQFGLKPAAAKTRKAMPAQFGGPEQAVGAPPPANPIEGGRSGGDIVS